MRESKSSSFMGITWRKIGYCGGRQLFGSRPRSASCWSSLRKNHIGYSLLLSFKIRVNSKPLISYSCYCKSFFLGYLIATLGKTDMVMAYSAGDEDIPRSVWSAYDTLRPPYDVRSLQSPKIRWPATQFAAITDSFGKVVDEAKIFNAVSLHRNISITLSISAGRNK